MLKITVVEVLQRTKMMLVHEWALSKRPPSTALLRKGGLGKNDLQIEALELPIENVHFADVDANVDTDELIKAKTVADLSDKIWAAIPAKNREEE